MSATGLGGDDLGRESSELSCCLCCQIGARRGGKMLGIRVVSSTVRHRDTLVSGSMIRLNRAA